MHPMDEDTLSIQLNTISEQRKQKVLRYRFLSGKQQSLMAYQLLQKALEEEYGITEPPVFKEQENGKPIIIGHEDIHFNISHCKYGVACAIDINPIGIDIERVPEKLDKSLVNYIFNKKEVDMINNPSDKDENGNLLTPNIMFTKLWTMKEATVKLTGRGITGKEQLQPLLNDWHNGSSEFQYITKYDRENKWVVSICFTS